MNKIHFIAIGGAIMHQLALALHHKGYSISGSDDEITDPAKTNLANAHLLPEKFGWFPEKIHTGVDAVVLGMHAKENNPELLAAKKLGIPVFSFPQYIYEVSKDKTRIVVAGSHGKTTITSMIMHILRCQGFDFDYMVGARVPGFDQSVRLSNAPLIVLEGDEYPASAEERKPKIFFYHPHITVLTGIAWDHINVFPTYNNYLSQFQQFLEGIDSGSTVYYNDEDAEVRRVIATSATYLKAVPYTTPAFHYDDGQTVIVNAEGAVHFSIFGRHNMLNMQAAVSVCGQLGISQATCYHAMATFGGAARRLEKLMEADGLMVYRDFAHAPSKLKATLDAVREAYPNHRLVACFELHTYSSLNENFLDQYAHTMDAADDAFVFFSSHALKLKGLPALAPQTVKAHFAGDNVFVTNDANILKTEVGRLISVRLEKPVFLLLMSSGTFDGVDWKQLAEDDIS